jgi:FkbM family methyltransferase
VLSGKLQQYFVHKDLYDKGLVYGSYNLSYEARLAASFLCPTAIVFDVGANAGSWTKSLVTQLEQMALDAKIYCFEPDAAHTNDLSALSLKDKVYFVPMGLSAESGIGMLYSDREKSGLSSLYLRDLDHHGINMHLSQDVNLLTLDSFVSQQGISQIDFLKIDVEGHELEVLKGASRSLSEDRIKAIQFEFGGCNIDSRTYFRDFHKLLVRQHGFRLFRLAPNFKLVDLSVYNESLEIFSWQNIVAIKGALPQGWHI